MTILVDPTGYAKSIEDRSNGVFGRSYVLGTRVEAQHDANDGTLHLASDGHGSTRSLVDPSGAVDAVFFARLADPGAEKRSIAIRFRMQPHG